MPEERRREINSYIQNRGSVTLADLSAHFPGVSEMTLRRDLEKLENMGELVRIRGGARSLSDLSLIREVAYTQRAAENVESKKNIAEKASGLIKSGQSIYLDAGTTCMALANQIVLADIPLFVLTPAPNIALELVRNAAITVMLTGGQLNRDTFTLTGSDAVDFTRSINIETAFVGASGFTPDEGFTCGYFHESELKQTIVGKARSVVILMDKSKIGHSLPYTFARPADVKTFVTDSKPNAEISTFLKSHGVSIL